MRSEAGPLLERFPSLRRLRLSSQRQVPHVQQLSETECGAACLAMVLGYLGKEVGLEEVRDVCAASRDGVSAADILEGGRRLGLRGRGVKVALAQLPLLEPGTTILHWQFQHFVVLARLGPDWVDIVDPAFGPRRVPLDEFSRSFTGVALHFEPSDLFTRKRRPGVLGATIRELLLGSGLLPHILSMSLVLQLFGLALPVLMGQLVDRVLPRGDVHLLALLMVGLTVVVLFQGLTEIVRGHLLLQLRTVLDARMTLGFLDHLVSLPYSYFQLRSSGDLMMRLHSNAIVRERLTSGTLTALVDGLLVSVYLAILFIGSRPMAFAALAATLLEVAVYLFTRRRQRELTDRGLQVEARSQSYEVEMLTAMDMLKATGNEQRAVAHWANLFVDALNVSLARERLTIKSHAILGGLRAAGPLVIIAVGAGEVLAGQLSLGAMLSLSAIAGAFLLPVSSLVETAISLQTVRGYLERVNDVLQVEPEQSPDRARPARRLGGRIALERISFRYGAHGPLAVEEVSLEIRPGQFVAIVGRSGSGKTTLANLLMGLYRPTSGRVLFDGIDLHELDLRSVRRQLGIVNQNVSLFGSTVRENIALHDPARSLDEVVAAAKLARIHEEILALPLGYNTPLLERGGSVSGGQKQRIALARALLHAPAILLLDEATSALDAIAEREVQASLQSLRCTRIVIAHRLSTIRDADQIVVLEGGRVVEIGDHAGLLEKRGCYARLVAAQLLPGHDPGDAS